jgi:hypothetical protein
MMAGGEAAAASFETENFAAGTAALAGTAEKIVVNV